MKSFKKKFLLLAMFASIACSSCNTYPTFGLFSWMLGKRVVKKQYSLVSFKSLLVLSAVLAAGCFVGWYFGLFDPKKESPEPTPNPVINPVPVPGPVNPLVNTNPAVPNNLPVDANFAQKRVEAVIAAATEKKILLDMTEVEVPLADGKKIVNTVYQLFVNSQFGLSNTCGARAIFNVASFSEIFDHNNGVFSVDLLNKLNDLNSLSSNVIENPKMRDFFKEIIANDSSIQHYSYNGMVDPVNFDERNLQKIIDSYKPEKNKQLKIKETDILDGYKESFDENETHNLATGISGRSGLKFYLIGHLINKPVGYCHSYVIMDGQHERESISRNSVGHWVSIFVVKTGENKYNWFIFDSMNRAAKSDEEPYASYVNSMRIKAYIYKLLGSRCQEFEDRIKASENEVLKAGQIANFNEIKAMVDGLKLINKDRRDLQAAINVSAYVMREIDKFKSESSTKQRLKENIKKFLLDEKCTELRLLNLVEQEKIDGLILDINNLVNSDNGLLKMGDLFADDKFVVIPDTEVARQFKAKSDFATVKDCVKDLLDNKGKEKKDFKVTPNFAVNIKKELNFKNLKENLSLTDIKTWLGKKKAFIATEIDGVSKVEKEELGRQIGELELIF